MRSLDSDDVNNNLWRVPLRGKRNESNHIRSVFADDEESEMGTYDGCEKYVHIPLLSNEVRFLLSHSIHFILAVANFYIVSSNYLQEYGKFYSIHSNL